MYYSPDDFYDYGPGLAMTFGSFIPGRRAHDWVGRRIVWALESVGFPVHRHEVDQDTLVVGAFAPPAAE